MVKQELDYKCPLGHSPSMEYTEVYLGHDGEIFTLCIEEDSVVKQQLSHTHSRFFIYGEPSFIALLGHCEYIGVL